MQGAKERWDQSQSKRWWWWDEREKWYHVFPMMVLIIRTIPNPDWLPLSNGRDSLFHFFPSSDWLSVLFLVSLFFITFLSSGNFIPFRDFGVIVGSSKKVITWEEAMCVMMMIIVARILGHQVFFVGVTQFLKAVFPTTMFSARRIWASFWFDSIPHHFIPCIGIIKVVFIRILNFLSSSPPHDHGVRFHHFSFLYSLKLHSFTAMIFFPEFIHSPSDEITFFLSPPRFTILGHHECSLLSVSPNHSKRSGKERRKEERIVTIQMAGQKHQQQEVHWITYITGCCYCFRYLQTLAYNVLMKHHHPIPGVTR